MELVPTDDPSQEQKAFENARLGAGNLYFDIVNNNMGDLNFEETVSTLTDLARFLDGKAKYKMDGIMDDLARTSELDPDILTEIFDELGIAPKKVSPKIVKLHDRKVKKAVKRVAGIRATASGTGAVARKKVRSAHTTVAATGAGIRTAAGAARSRSGSGTRTGNHSGGSARSRPSVTNNPVLQSGRSMQDDGDLEGAIYYYQQAVSEGCRDLDVINELAALFMLIGDMDHAIKFYDIALNIDENNLDILSDKAAALVIDGQYNEAIICQEIIIKLDPSRKHGWKEKGVLLVKLGKHHRAIQCFEQILRIDPDDVEAIGNMALCYKEMGDSKKEIDYLNRFLKHNPDDRDAWMERADIFIRYGRQKSALKCYNAVLKNDQNDFIVLRKKADALNKMGLHAEAETCINRANALMPIKVPMPEPEEVVHEHRYHMITDGLTKLGRSSKSGLGRLRDSLLYDDVGDGEEE